MSEEQRLNRARFRLAILKEMRAVHRQRQDTWGLKRDKLAERMGMDEARVSRILNGDEVLTIGLVAEFFHALEAHPTIRAELYEQIESCWRKWHAGIDAALGEKP